jgi:hypothetical protein
VDLEQGPVSLVSTIEELLGRKSSCSGLESREYAMWYLLSAKVGTNLPDKRQPLGRYSSLDDSGQGVFFFKNTSKRHSQAVLNWTVETEERTGRNYFTPAF